LAGRALAGSGRAWFTDLSSPSLVPRLTRNLRPA
jgi:hypothetical protein